jgi:DMSO reductase family type II enzyme chaperone
MLDTSTMPCDLALARAVLYRVASQAFRHPDQAWHAEWCTLAEAAREAARVCLEEDPAAAPLVSAVEDVLARTRDLPGIVAEHARVLGHIPRAAATPYETEWTGAAGDLLQYHQISDIASFYNAFGLELGQGCDERPDHITVELEFLHYLCVKEAWAAEQGWSDRVDFCRETEKRFLSEHLARWANGLCSRLAVTSRGGFYESAGNLLRAWLEDESRRLAVEPCEPILEPVATSYRPEDACTGCGHSASCLAELSRDDESRA